jgi:general stress protein 26
MNLHQCSPSERAPWGGLSLLLIFMLIQTSSEGQIRKESPNERDSVIAAAREIIGTQKYCALVTVDSSERPQIRTMNPFPPDDNMVVWMATNSRSRKVKEILNNPHVALFYGDLGHAVGYVSITGTAVLVDDMQEKLKRKRAYWDQAFKDWKYLLLIKVVPEELEVINYSKGMVNEPMTWRAPAVSFGKPAPAK